MQNIKKIITNMLFFSEPEKVEKFILKETEPKNGESEHSEEKPSKEKGSRKKEPRKIRKLIDDDEDSSGKQEDMEEDEEKGQKEEKGEKGEKEKPSEISKKLSDNLAFMKKKYSIPTNGDIVIREFDIIVKDKPINAFIIFIDGMTDRKVINDNILQPLMLLSNLDIKNGEKNISDYIKKSILPFNQIKEAREYQKIVDEVNFGGCGIFVDGMDSAFTADVKGWGARGVERPNTELVIRGPQEGFNETIRTNTALIRKRLKDEDLIVENLSIGERSKTPVSMLYIKDIADESLVKEVRKGSKASKLIICRTPESWNNI